MFNYSDLTVTLRVTPEISPSILSNYVQEAPKDDKAYGRENGEWVEVEKVQQE